MLVGARNPMLCPMHDSRREGTALGINYEGDVRQLAELGFDAVKLDGCGAQLNMSLYGTFQLNFHRFDRFELDLRGRTQAWGAAFSCLRLNWADMVLI